MNLRAQCVKLRHTGITAIATSAECVSTIVMLTRPSMLVRASAGRRLVSPARDCGRDDTVPARPLASHRVHSMIAADPLPGATLSTGAAEMLPGSVRAIASTATNIGGASFSLSLSRRLSLAHPVSTNDADGEYLVKPPQGARLL